MPIPIWKAARNAAVRRPRQRHPPGSSGPGRSLRPENSRAWLRTAGVLTQANFRAWILTFSGDDDLAAELPRAAASRLAAGISRRRRRADRQPRFLYIHRTANPVWPSASFVPRIRRVTRRIYRPRATATAAPTRNPDRPHEHAAQGGYGIGRRIPWPRFVRKYFSHAVRCRPNGPFAGGTDRTTLMALGLATSCRARRCGPVDATVKKIRGDEEMHKVKLGGGLSLLLALALLSPIAAQAQTTVSTRREQLRNNCGRREQPGRARPGWHARTDRTAGLPVHGRRQVVGGQ